jgi:hypothetical protein
MVPAHLNPEGRTQLAAGGFEAMKKQIVTAVALAALLASAFGAVQAAHTVREACIPPALVQAWS